MTSLLGAARCSFPLAGREHADRKCLQAGGLALGGHPAHESLVPAGRQIGRRSVPRHRQRLRLRDQHLAVEQRHLEIEEVLVEASPVETARLVVLEVLGGRCGE